MGRGHKHTQTFQLLDRIGPVGRFGENCMGRGQTDIATYRLIQPRVLVGEISPYSRLYLLVFGESTVMAKNKLKRTQPVLETAQEN